MTWPNDSSAPGVAHVGQGDDRGLHAGLGQLAVAADVVVDGAGAEPVGRRAPAADRSGRRRSTAAATSRRLPAATGGGEVGDAHLGGVAPEASQWRGED